METRTRKSVQRRAKYRQVVLQPASKNTHIRRSVPPPRVAMFTKAREITVVRTPVRPFAAASCSCYRERSSRDLSSPSPQSNNKKPREIKQRTGNRVYLSVKKVHRVRTQRCQNTGERHALDLVALPLITRLSRGEGLRLAAS